MKSPKAKAAQIPGDPEAKPREQLENPLDIPFFYSDEEATSKGLMLNAEMERLQQAGNLLRAIVTKSTHIETFGKSAAHCPEPRIAYRAFLSLGNAADEITNQLIEWGHWVRDCVADKNTDAFKRMSRLVAGLHRTARDGKLDPQWPDQVSPKDLGIKLAKGRPRKNLSTESTLNLFAGAALPHVEKSIVSRRKPTAKQIRDEPAAPPVPLSLASRGKRRVVLCVAKCEPYK